jgi:hypothetical protein
VEWNAELFPFLKSEIKTNFGWSMAPKILTTAALAAMLSVFSAGWSAQPDTASMRTRVSVSSIIQSNRVPLNRTVDFTIRVAWEGPVEAVELGDLIDPVFSNLEVAGSSSSNRVSGIPGGQSSIKDVVYTLKPKTLGMAYIDPASLSYTDRNTGLVHSLRTRRMSVEAVSPVPEKGGGSGLWFRIFFGAMFAAGIAFGGWLFVRQKKLRAVHETTVPTPIMEENFLGLLKSTVDLAGPGRRESFSALSKLFRRYLAERFRINAASATTPDLVLMLAEKGADESLVRKCESVLSKADVVQFSGKDATQAELDEAYTFVETVLEARLAEERTRLAQAKVEKEKDNKSGFLKLLKKK